MSGNPKKNLTTAEDRQDIVIRKLKQLALERQNGIIECKILFREGLISEIRHREVETVIR